MPNPTKDWVKCVCQNCSKQFSVFPAYVKRGGGKFCSKSCQVIDQHKNGTNKAARQREKHHNWKGGRLIDRCGYVRVLAPEHPMALGSGYVLEHVLVACKMIGRTLRKNEVVHHKDENRQNNSPENLQVMTRGAHVRLHKALNQQRAAAASAPADG